MAEDKHQDQYQIDLQIRSNQKGLSLSKPLNAMPALTTLSLKDI